MFIVRFCASWIAFCLVSYGVLNLLYRSFRGTWVSTLLGYGLFVRSLVCVWAILWGLCVGGFFSSRLHSGPETGVSSQTALMVVANAILALGWSAVQLLPYLSVRYLLVPRVRFAEDWGAYDGFASRPFHALAGLVAPGGSIWRTLMRFLFWNVADFGTYAYFAAVNIASATTLALYEHKLYLLFWKAIPWTRFS